MCPFDQATGGFFVSAQIQHDPTTQRQKLVLWKLAKKNDPAVPQASRPDLLGNLESTTAKPFDPTIKAVC